MRTTLEINDPLFRKAKKRAASDGVSLRQVVETSLQAYLARRPAAAAYVFHWRTERGRIQPGVRLDDREALFDLMEGRR